MESVIERKNNSLLVVILLLLLIGVSGYVVYDKVLKKDVGTSEKQDVLTNDLALNVVKEKYNAATGFLSGLRCDDSTSIDNFYCYYGEKDWFEKAFHYVYSNKLSFKDVYVEYDFKTEKESTNIVGIAETSNTNDIDDDTNFVLHYGYNGDSVYVDKSCRVSGHGTEVKDFKIESLTADKIEASFIAREDLNEITLGITDAKEIEKIEKDYNDISKFDRHKIILVKEDGLYKISSGVLVDSCGHLYKIGK